MVGGMLFQKVSLGFDDGSQPQRRKAAKEAQRKMLFGLPSNDSFLVSQLF
jgi:hypothetical protein